MSDLSKFVLCIEELRKVFPTMTLQGAALFLYIASHGECRAADLTAFLGLADSSISNIARRLDARGFSNPAMALIKYEKDKEDWRKKVFSLAPRGERIVRSLLSTLREDSQIL